MGTFPNCVVGNKTNGPNGNPGNGGGYQYATLGYQRPFGSPGSPGQAGNGGGPGGEGGIASCTTCMMGFDGGPFCSQGNTMVFGNPGQPGCGGGGGGGGNGGAGGGASIAIYVTGGGLLVLKSGTLFSATVGAAGGSGAGGVGGANGSVGMPGMPAGGPSGMCNGIMCMAIGGGCVADGGPGGAAGGNGGTGGQGGGGAGGASIAIVVQNGVSLDIRDGSVASWSNGGDGGSANGPVGDQGFKRTF
jgi:hypothetical protein